MEPTLGLCIGCGRSLDEIAQWGRMWDAERLEIMAQLPERMKNLSRRRSGRVLPSQRRRNERS